MKLLRALSLSLIPSASTECQYMYMYHRRTQPNQREDIQRVLFRPRLMQTLLNTRHLRVVFNALIKQHYVYKTNYFTLRDIDKYHSHRNHFKTGCGDIVSVCFERETILTLVSKDIQSLLHLHVGPPLTSTIIAFF